MLRLWRLGLGSLLGGVERLRVGWRERAIGCLGAGRNSQGVGTAAA